MQEVTENMKFNKKLTYNGVLNIPTEALRLSGIPEEARVEIHALNGAVVVLKERMTAMELIRALDAIHQLEVNLTVRLSKVCCFCIIRNSFKHIAVIVIFQQLPAVFARSAKAAARLTTKKMTSISHRICGMRQASPQEQNSVYPSTMRSTP